MTEERKFCRICKNLGIDCEAGTFYCSLSHRPDKLPNTLKCDEFILCDSITRLEQENKELKAQNERLKEEVETRDNLVEHFRKEAINWAKISNDCIKDIENYKQTLQEIKKIAEIAFAVCDDDCGNANKFTEILDLITKAEEE